MKTSGSTARALRVSGDLASVVFSSAASESHAAARGLEASSAPRRMDMRSDGGCRTLVLRGEHGNGLGKTITSAAVKAAGGAYHREGSSTQA